MMLVLFFLCYNHAHLKMLSITKHKGNAHQNHNEILPHSVRMAIIKKTGITSVDEDVDKRKPSCTVGGNIN